MYNYVGNLMIAGVLFCDYMLLLFPSGLFRGAFERLLQHERVSMTGQ